MSKTELKITIPAYVIQALIIFAAVFSPTGLGIVVEGYEWFASPASILENFVPVLAILSFIISAIVIIATLMIDGFFEKTVEASIENKGSAKAAYDALALKPLRMVWSVVYWGLLISAGWVFSAVVMIISASTIHFHRVLQRKLAEEYLDREDSGLTEEERLVRDLKAKVALKIKNTL